MVNTLIRNLVTFSHPLNLRVSSSGRQSGRLITNYHTPLLRGHGVDECHSYVGIRFTHPRNLRVTIAVWVAWDTFRFSHPRNLRVT